MNPLLAQAGAVIACAVYGSFFEWFWHKQWMHHPREPKEAFRGHTIVHHGLYKGDDSFFVEEELHAEHVLLKPYALPALIAIHLPIIYLIDRFLVPHTAVAIFLSTLAYFFVYEYVHWNMHVPRKQFIERFAWFRFLRQHHKLHHRYMQKNFCVLIPLADWVCGTLITDKMLAKQKAAREAAISSGQSLAKKGVRN